VDHQDVPRLHQLRGKPADPGTLFDEGPAAFAIGRLYAHRNGGRATIRAGNETLPAEGVEVAPHRFGRNPEPLRKMGDPHVRLELQLAQDDLLSLRLADARLHARASSSASATSANPSPPLRLASQRGCWRT